MVYTDKIHVTADTIDELYKYASKVNLNPDEFILMGKTIHPHFIMTEDVRQMVLEDVDVKIVSSRELVKICQLNFRLPQTDNELSEWEDHHKKHLSDLTTPTKSEYERMLSNIFKRAKLK